MAVAHRGTEADDDGRGSTAARLLRRPPAAEKRQAVREILRRVAPAQGDLPEAALIAAADELFRVMDGEETGRFPR
jgi:hypothetical protein